MYNLSKQIFFSWLSWNREIKEKIIKNPHVFILPILFVLLSGNISSAVLHAQSTWDWQNPLPQGADMYYTFPVSENKAVITGNGGTVMTTNDAGRQWNIQRLPKVDRIVTSSFISELVGWGASFYFDITALGDSSKTFRSNKIFKTEDGGESWKELSIEINMDSTNYIDGLHFINSELGYLIANPSPAIDDKRGFIYKTTDGGIHWKEFQTGINRQFFQILFTDSLNGFLLSQPEHNSFYFEESLLHRTSDAGRTWTTMNDTGFSQIKFVSKLIGWAGNYKTEDGGKTWHYKNFNFPELKQSINKITFADENKGFAISGTTILMSSDQGDTWNINAELNFGLLTDIEFFNSNIGYVCGHGGMIYYTNDGGKNWIRYGSGAIANLQDVFFIDINTGWATGYPGTVLATKNGGNNWENQSIPDECDSVFFRTTYFIDSKNGWLVGGGFILHTSDGGNEWQIQLKVDLHFAGRFNDIQFLDEQTGYVIGQQGFSQGIIYKTNNGGISWLRIDEGDYPPLNKLYFINKEKGWICGSGIVLSTTDGANTWQSKSFRNNFQDMQFVNEYNGWLSAWDELSLYHTEDGGIIWDLMPMGDRFYSPLTSYFFFNDYNGIGFTSVNSDLLITNSGGLDWLYLEKLPFPNINDLLFLNDSTGWAVGRNGAIIKFHKSYFNLTSVDTFDNVSTSSNVSGIYPNPFNSTTTIYFELAKPQEVDVAIYNMLGERVDNFRIDGSSGTNNKQWNLKQNVSGVYFIKIQCPEFSKVIKSVILK